MIPDEMIFIPPNPQRQVDFLNLHDLTGTLNLLHIVATGSFSVVYRCSHSQTTEVAVKAFTVPPGFGSSEKEEYIRKVRRSLEKWRRLTHRNVVPLLGTARGKNFGSDYPCVISPWMKNGTLNEYVKQRGAKLSPLDRIHLIKGLVTGLEYLHSQGVVHGNFHPGNILIDNEHHACISDFGFSMSASPMQDQVSYLWTDTVRPSKPMWTAPEVLYPHLYPTLVFETTIQSDIYSLGSVILFVLSNHYPWKTRAEAENALKEFHNPPRPVWPTNMPDRVWDFIKICWSPRNPLNRPSAREALSFCTDSLENLLRPDPTSEINVVLLGALGSGKSSVINLLLGKDIAQTSSDVGPCTKQPRGYPVSIHDKRFRLWDTMGFFHATEGPTSHLSPYEHAHTVLRNLTDGANLILICVSKDQITPSLRRLYWLINHFFYGGRAPIAFVVTHCDTPDDEWWERNEGDIAQRTSIPVGSIPHACITTVLDDRDLSRRTLEELLHTAAVAPVSLRLDLPLTTTASLDFATHCKITRMEAMGLIEKFRHPPHLPFNVVLVGETGAEIDPIINLISKYEMAVHNLGEATCVHSYEINTGMQRFRIWDTMGSRKIHHDGSQRNHTFQLIHDLHAKGGVDLLVFCKTRGPLKLTAEQLDNYRLFQQTCAKGKFPVATLLASTGQLDSPVEKRLEVNDKHRDVMGHFYSLQLASHHLDNVELDTAGVRSRLAIEAIFEDCVASRSTRGRVKAVFGTRMPLRKNTTSMNFLTSCYGFRECTEGLIS